MNKLLDRWFALGWNIVGIGVSILILPFTLVMGLIILVVSKIFR